MGVADKVLADRVPWPTARLQWRASLARTADWFLSGELQRQNEAAPVLMESDARGRIDLPQVNGSLTGIADRIDTRHDGAGVIVYDYKSGSPPSKREQTHFDKQLLLEAAIIAQGGITALGPVPVAGAAYIGLGAKPSVMLAPIEDMPPQDVLAELSALIGAYLDPAQHYTSRRMLQTDAEIGDYDHLARYGEWDDADAPVPVDLT